MKNILLGTALSLLLTTPALAQEQAVGKDSPIEITADKSLEWHRNEKQYVAKVNAMIQQGTTIIKGDTITADYRETKETDFDIYRLTAEGNVTIDSNGSVATGDRGVYDVTVGTATLTGSDLRMTSPDQTVTATEKFEYAVNEGRLKAIGNATIISAEDRLSADTITAFLTPDANGKHQLDHVDANGNVKILTPTETLTGGKGRYDAKSNTAIVTGNVKIVRGPNTLTGERAEVNLTTNISQLFGNSIEDGKTGGRVRGVFYPESKKH